LTLGGAAACAVSPINMIAANTTTIFTIRTMSPSF
jgi:hypothetical protein